MYKNIFSFIGLLFVFSAGQGQEEWKLKSDKDGIKTYSRKLTDSKINTVKVESVFPASVAQFGSVTLDVKFYDNGIYKNK